MPRPTAWMRMVATSRDEARLAVRLYNESSLPRALEGFVVHMHLAWLYLLHAGFTRDGVDIRFPHSARKGWFEKIDGEFKTWDLAKCVRTRWPDGAVRANLEFFILFRNKIEHRYAQGDEALAAAVGAKSHALLLNYEEELTTQFGQAHSLANQLRFPVFVGTFTEPAEEALRRLQRSLPSDIHRFLADYDAGLDDDVRGDSRYALRLRVVLQTAGGQGDLAIQFDRYEDLTEQQRAAVDDLGRTGRVIVRQQDRPVQNQNLIKPGQVVRQVAERIPFVFNSHDFLLAWRKSGVRPPSGSADPRRTKADFCVYDSMHHDYGYTQSYVDFLSRKCATAKGFIETVGRAPRSK